MFTGSLKESTESSVKPLSTSVVFDENKNFTLNDTTTRTIFRVKSYAPFGFVITLPCTMDFVRGSCRKKRRRKKGEGPVQMGTDDKTKSNDKSTMIRVCKIL